LITAGWPAFGKDEFLRKGGASKKKIKQKQLKKRSRGGEKKLRKSDHGEKKLQHCKRR